jgi:hypothetical protein
MIGDYPFTGLQIINYKSSSLNTYDGSYSIITSSFSVYNATANEYKYIGFLFNSNNINNLFFESLGGSYLNSGRHVTSDTTGENIDLKLPYSLILTNIYISPRELGSIYDGKIGYFYSRFPKIISVFGRNNNTDNWVNIQRNIQIIFFDYTDNELTYTSNSIKFKDVPIDSNRIPYKQFRMVVHYITNGDELRTDRLALGRVFFNGIPEPFKTFVIYTTSGEYTPTTTITDADVLIVGGGGGGGGGGHNAISQGGGGGGAGSVGIGKYTFIAGTKYIIEIGGGGNGGKDNKSSSTAAFSLTEAEDGLPTYLKSSSGVTILEAKGGGRGKTSGRNSGSTYSSAGNGGSGGGASWTDGQNLTGGSSSNNTYTNFTFYHNNGGSTVSSNSINIGCGGGGASTIGGTNNSSLYIYGKGGDGKFWLDGKIYGQGGYGGNIKGQLVNPNTTTSGYGGGNSTYSLATGGDGFANTGNGGGGGGSISTYPGSLGGKGGSGIFIIAY